MRQDGDKTIYSVTDLNNQANNVLGQIQVWIEGEVFQVSSKERNYRYVYFYLKDPKTEYQVSCITEPHYLVSSGLELKEGTSLVAFGTLGVWAKGGKYQFTVTHIQPVGEGELLKRLQLLKAQLQQEGLFADERKKAIPQYPSKIGVITSATSAAWQDFKKNSYDKFPFLEITLKDVFVQGVLAVKDIVAAIQELDQYGLDVLVITRGGGSLEDLMAFNSEEIARAIARCKTPVISAVGHEVDVTIADLVADHRASTPTNAAEFLVREYYQLVVRINQIYSLLQTNTTRRLAVHADLVEMLRKRMFQTEQKYKNLPDKLENLKTHLSQSRRFLIDEKFRQLDDLNFKLETGSQNLLKKYQQSLSLYGEKLRLLSPVNTLQRGYSIVKDDHNRIVRDSAQVAVGQKVAVQFAQGGIITQVTEKK